ncbi:hypothetical protein BFW01_g12016 [Lasiodiplodia theobromae]|uniref:Putative transcriptional regulatory protein n=1 Tax=Lasiodiplodia theobromae TaxID=45133 RepID=A0A5N5DBD2_9PEZI|nr:C6 transcription factor [Lasiodiplodia theobromae]KAB2574991.1 putative transcriptional regulatory protein [Lasiodiplodia theobromae]KAF4534226.1 C6 transcription factor [Lasiodiplodia theobromae]KAF9640210.1 hypothetical protein BFW01_g12016 [Lasiodiplodia theobromae]
MRSSIACARCRRSKVKCVNNGVGTTCRACETTGRECTYPSPAAGAGGGVPVARRESSSQSGHPVLDRVPAGETPRRQPRPKKSSASIPGTSSSNRDSPHALVDALDPTILTPKVWTELFDIFQTHYSTDLPFLHPPTFLKPLRQSSLQSSNSGFGDPASGPLPALSPLLLLAFLALTSRFHPQLVAYHSTSTSKQNPQIAAEYYASACRNRIASMYGGDPGVPDLQRIQAMLMLGLHEWGSCQGSKAWVTVGIAIRGAQLLGLQFEADLDDMPLARSTAMVEEARHLGVNVNQREYGLSSKGDAFIEQETRRRTFWSCFIMDRYLSSGKYRPQMLNIQDLRIQLPCSERAFLFGEKVKTLMLGEEIHDVAGRAHIQHQRKASVMLGSKSGSPNGGTPVSSDRSPVTGTGLGREDEEDGRWEVGSDEGILSRFIKVLDLYGRIVKWSCSGGRRREQYPPWDERSTFSTLQRLHSRARDGLPRDMTLTSANISAHITSRTSTPFVLMHIVHLLSGMILNREYIPFIPLRSPKPQGPLDPPVFPSDEYTVPEGFWEQSARELFKSARDVIDLLRICQEWNVLVETPIVGFAAYTAAFTGVYAINFPWMDPHGYMCKGTQSRDPVKSETGDSPGAEAARKALEIISQMRRALHMADGWFRTLKRVHVYYIRIKKDFRRNAKAMASLSPGAESLRSLTLREGGPGGGLEEYKLLEKSLREFGSLWDEGEDLEMLDAGDEERRPDTSSSIPPGEAMDTSNAPDAIRQERWNAINTVAAAASQQNAANGATTYGPGRIPISNPSPEQQKPPQLPGHSPILSPPGSASAASNTPYDRPSGFTPIQHQQHPHANPADSYGTHQPSYTSASSFSPASQEAWLDSLDTRFGGDDIAAFVAGTNWEDWAAMAQPGEQGVSGWLSAVWMGAPGPPPTPGRS